MNTHARPLVRSLLLLATLHLAAAAPAQTWVAFDAMVPGTPAEVTLVAADSGPLASVVELRIHGFWRESVVGADGQAYDRISVPGLPGIGQVGAPGLPALRFALAVPTDAKKVTLATLEALDTRLFTGLNVYPAPSPGDDEDIDPTGDPGPGNTQGSDDKFSKDAAIYASTQAWPATPDAGPADVESLLGAVPAGLCEAYPATWNPSTKLLTIQAHVKFTYLHGGGLVPQPELTQSKGQAAGAVFVNWGAVKFTFPEATDSYHSRYLIVTRSEYVDALEAFVQHKKTLGFDTVVSVPDQLTNAGVQAVIEGWYAQGSPGMDHFCLLVGDTSTIPLWNLPAGIGLSDDPYGSTNGDTFKEISVGRLSVDGTGDILGQTGKIMEYEISPEPDGDYGEVLLVAHLENAPFKYTLAQMLVMGGSYATPPAFLTRFGSLGAMNSGVQFDVEEEVGLVAYRGHGSTNTWSEWNTSNQDFHKNDVVNLQNDGVKPVVWSIACTNNNLNHDPGSSVDCLGEVWMEVDDRGAIAHYGATGTTGTHFNDALDSQLFKTVYDAGLVTHGPALDMTELIMWIAGWQDKNTRRYLLLGDPSMKIRREKPAEFHFTIPTGLVSSDGDGSTTDLQFQLLSQTGQPIPGSLVSIWKQALIPGKPDEVLTNAYTDDLGFANFVVELSTPGELHFAAQDGNGNVSVGVAPVGFSQAWVALPGGAPGTYGTPKLSGMGPMTANSLAQLVVTDAKEFSSAWLILGFSQIDAPFKGGVLVPNPDIVAGGLSTSADGHFEIGFTLPGIIPPGLPLYSQYWILDPAGPKGFSATNGLLGTTF